MYHLGYRPSAYTNVPFGVPTFLCVFSLFHENQNLIFLFLYVITLILYFLLKIGEK